MRKFKLIIALAVALSTSALALEPVKGDDRAFRLSEDEARICKEQGGCTIITNNGLAEDAQIMMQLMQAVDDLQKKLKAEQSKRCI